MARRNGNGEGSRPRERADGRWEARYWVGDKRRSVYGSPRKEAADKFARTVANGDESYPTFTAMNITVKEFFAQYDDAVRDTMKRRSLETYRDIARLHLLPAFGSCECPAPCDCRDDHVDSAIALCSPHFQFIEELWP